MKYFKVILFAVLALEAFGLSYRYIPDRCPAPFKSIEDLDAFMYTLEYEDRLTRPLFRPHYVERFGKYNCIELSRFYKWAAEQLGHKCDLAYFSSGLRGHTAVIVDGEMIDWSAILSGRDISKMDYTGYKIIK